MSAAAAVGVILSHLEPLGYEVMIPHRIKPTEIVAVRNVAQKLGCGNTVYLISPDHRPTDDDGSELITNCTLIKGKRGTFPADVFRSANSDQFLRTLGRYAQFKCEAYRRSCRNEYYMLRPELWRKVCRFNDMLAAYYCCVRSVPASRHFRLGQSNLGNRLDSISLHRRARIFDLPGKRHGGS